MKEKKIALNEAFRLHLPFRSPKCLTFFLFRLFVISFLKKINPFVNNTPPWSWKIALQSILVIIFILPLRLLIFCPSIAIAWILDAVAQTGHYIDDEPMANWRVRIVNWSSYFWKVWLFSLSFHKIKVEGFPANRNEAPICVVNHTTFIDVFIMYACKRFMFVGKKEVTKIPFGREIFRAGQTILVDRTDKESSKRAKEAIRSRVTHKVEDGSNAPEWPTLVVFPEGTCTNGTALITFKKGPFIAGVPVQPITIKYHRTTVDPCKVYGGGPGIGILLFRLLTSLNNTVTVNFLDVYQPSLEEKNDPLMFAENVRLIMAHSLKVQVTNHSYADVQLLLQARKAGIRRRSLKNLNLETQTLSDILNADLSMEKFRYFLKEFHRVAGQSGELTKKQFFQILQMPHTALTDRIYQLFDIDSNGVLQFREFMAGIALLYFNQDKAILPEIVSTRTESGKLYFDKNELVRLGTIQRFATFRTMYKSSENATRTPPDSPSAESFRSVSLRSNDPAQDKVWWTPDELFEYIKDNPEQFKWLQNPSFIKDKDKVVK